MIEVLPVLLVSAVLFIVLLKVMGSTPVIETLNWRWCKDDAATPTTFWETENTAHTLAGPSEVLRLRISDRCTIANQSVTSHKLQYSTDGSTWYDMSSTNHWNYYNGAGTDGSTIASRILTDSDTNGYYVESNASISWTHTKNTVREQDVCIQPTSYATNNQLYYFRWVQNGTGISPASGETRPQATTWAGNYEVSPSAIGSAGGVGTPSITVNREVDPSDIGSSGGVGTPTITQNVAVDPSDIGSSAGVGTPTIVEQLNYVVDPSDMGSQPGVGTPTVNTNYALTPSGIGSQPGVGTPTVNTNYALTPSGVGSQPGVGTPTANTNYALDPTDVGSQPGVGIPTVNTNYDLDPSDVGSAGGVGTPTVAEEGGGDKEVDPVDMGAACGVGTPTIVQNVEVDPSDIGSAGGVGTPTVNTNYALAPTGIGSAGGVGSPTVNTTYSLTILDIGSVSKVGLPVVVEGEFKHENIYLDSELCVELDLTSNQFVGQTTVELESDDFTMSIHRASDLTQSINLTSIIFIE